MDKITYLAELAEGLARWVPERDRRDILRYYAEYFEEAGADREAEVVAELGDPWALSCRLAVEGGYVTHENAASWTPRRKWPRVLIGTAVGLSVFALVFSVGMLVTNAIQSFTRNPIDSTAEVLLEEGITFAENMDSTMEYYLMDGQRVEAFDSIDADISLGNIQVLAGDDYTLSIRRSNSLTDCDPAWEVRNGVLRLKDSWPRQARVSSWGDLMNMFGVSQAVEVVITVPEGAALDNINVETGLGDVLLYGVNAETVTVKAGLGDVECYEARNVRKLRLSTGVGDVCLGIEEIWPDADIELESGTGSVEASLGCSERDCRYELESGLGAVTVNGSYRGGEAERKGSAPYKLRAESGTGDVSVYFTLD